MSSVPTSFSNKFPGIFKSSFCILFFVFCFLLVNKWNAEEFTFEWMKIMRKIGSAGTTTHQRAAPKYDEHAKIKQMAFRLHLHTHTNRFILMKSARVYSWTSMPFHFFFFMSHSLHGWIQIDTEKRLKKKLANLKSSSGNQEIKKNTI